METWGDNDEWPGSSKKQKSPGEKKIISERICIQSKLEAGRLPREANGKGKRQQR